MLVHHHRNSTFRSVVPALPLPVPGLFPVPGPVPSAGGWLRASGGVVSGGVVPGGGRLRGEGSLEGGSLARARRSHGERRAALAGPVHSPGHQLCGHSLPVFRVPAEGPGRPGAQGQCPSPPGLSRPCRPGGKVSPPTCRGPLHPLEKTPQRNQALGGRRPAPRSQDQSSGRVITASLPPFSQVLVTQNKS